MGKWLYGLAACLLEVEAFAEAGLGEGIVAALLGIAAGVYLCLFLDDDDPR